MALKVLELFQFVDGEFETQCGVSGKKWKDDINYLGLDINKDQDARFVINNQLRLVLMEFGQRAGISTNTQRYLLDNKCEISSWKHIIKTVIIPFCAVNGVFVQTAEDLSCQAEQK